MVREICRTCSRLQLVPLPSYAPELNPDEGVWNFAKGSLANGRPDQLDELDEHLSDALQRLAGSQVRLRACLYRSGLSF